MDVIPDCSLKTYWSVSPGDWNTSLTKIIAPSVEIPGTSDPLCFRVNSFSVALNPAEISSKI